MHLKMWIGIDLKCTTYICKVPGLQCKTQYNVFMLYSCVLPSKYYFPALLHCYHCFWRSLKQSWKAFSGGILHICAFVVILIVRVSITVACHCLLKSVE